MSCNAPGQSPGAAQWEKNNFVPLWPAPELIMASELK